MDDPHPHTLLAAIAAGIVFEAAIVYAAWLIFS